MVKSCGVWFYESRLDLVLRLVSSRLEQLVTPTPQPSFWLASHTLGCDSHTNGPGARAQPTGEHPDGPRHPDIIPTGHSRARSPCLAGCFPRKPP